MAHLVDALATAIPAIGSTSKERLINMTKALAKKTISKELERLPDWLLRKNAIHRTFEFDGFLQSIDFVNRIALEAQKANHHPDMDIRFDQVTLTLTTHDAGGILEQDFALAEQCDEVYSRMSGV
jgi:4a-hydroxytetrahydrobiopterin dehydratase